LNSTNLSITLTWAQTLNGLIAPSDKSRLALSGTHSSRLTHQLRAEHDGILVGIGTVLADNPRLTCRLPLPPRQPVRIILDSQLRLPLEAALFHDIQQSPLWVLCVQGSNSNHSLLEARGARVVCLPSLHPKNVIEFLHQEGLKTLMVEGGQSVLSSFFNEGLFHRLVITLCPKFLTMGIPCISLKKETTSSDLMDLSQGKWEQLGSDMVFDWWRSG